MRGSRSLRARPATTSGGPSNAAMRVASPPGPQRPRSRAPGSNCQSPVTTPDTCRVNTSRPGGPFVTIRTRARSGPPRVGTWSRMRRRPRSPPCSVTGSPLASAQRQSGRRASTRRVPAPSQRQSASATTSWPASSGPRSTWSIGKTNTGGLERSGSAGVQRSGSAGVQRSGLAGVQRSGSGGVVRSSSHEAPSTSRMRNRKTRMYSLAGGGRAVTRRRLLPDHANGEVLVLCQHHHQGLPLDGSALCLGLREGRAGFDGCRQGDGLATHAPRSR